MSINEIQEILVANPYFVVILLALGYALKHAAPKLQNGTIPVILIVIGVILGIVFAIPVTNSQAILEAAVNGIASGAVAVGIHSTGKNILYLRRGNVSLDADTEIADLIDTSDSENDGEPVDKENTDDK